MPDRRLRFPRKTCIRIRTLLSKLYQYSGEDILQAVNEAYAGGRFWPAPLIQLNPNFVPGGSIDDFVSTGTLDEECAKVFRLKRPIDTFGKQLVLHQNQAEAIEIAGVSTDFNFPKSTDEKSPLWDCPVISRPPVAQSPPNIYWRQLEIFEARRPLGKRAVKNAERKWRIVEFGNEIAGSLCATPSLIARGTPRGFS